jgi:hypothetical protein
MVAIATEPVRVTRTIRYEIEKLLPALDSDCPYANAYMGWWPSQRWSDMRIVFIGSTEPGQGITVGFDAPYDNTYEVKVGATKGVRYANAAVRLDGERIGTIKGFSDEPNLLPLKIPPVSLGKYALTKGKHAIRFEVEDRDPRALEWVLGPDVMFITSTEQFPSRIDTQSSSGIGLQITYSLNGEVGYRLTIPEDLIIDADLSIFDILGRRVQTLKQGLMGGITEGKLLTEPTSPLAHGVYYLYLRQSLGEAVCVPLILSR